MPRRSGNRITRQSIDALCATGESMVVWDRELPGFGVRVHTTGRKVYVVQARGPAGSKRLSLGRHGELSPIQARKQAGIVIGRIKRGEDPIPKPPAPALTVADLAERFSQAHIAPNCKATTAELYRGVIDNHILPVLGDTRSGRWDARTLRHCTTDSGTGPARQMPRFGFCRKCSARRKRGA